MSKDRYVIARKYIPANPFPVVPWVVLLLALDVWGAPGWLWGLLCGAMGVITLSVWLIVFGMEKDVHPADLPRT
jgi:hypothetical protein